MFTTLQFIKLTLQQNPHVITPYPAPEEISQNFSTEIKKENYTIAKFYLPWCAYTQINVPVWNKLASEYKNPNHQVRFVNVNCEQMETERYCYPTFRIYKNGKQISEFRATWPRNYDIFEAWLNRDLEDKKPHQKQILN